MPKVTMAVKGTRAHRGMLAIDAEIDGEFDKANLPNPLILSFYFIVEADLIVSLFIMRNRSASETLIRPTAGAALSLEVNELRSNHAAPAASSPRTRE